MIDFLKQFGYEENGNAVEDAQRFVWRVLHVADSPVVLLKEVEPLSLPMISRISYQCNLPGIALLLPTEEVETFLNLAGIDLFYDPIEHIGMKEAGLIGSVLGMVIICHTSVSWPTLVLGNKSVFGRTPSAVQRIAE